MRHEVTLKGAGNPKDAFATFRAKTGRPAKLATLPPGGTPTIALRYWLKQNDVAATDVQIVSMGIDAVQGAMLTGAVDGATVLEPSLTLVRERSADVRGRRLLLVDDVFTTGATAHECARTLRRAGAAEVGARCGARMLTRVGAP